MKATEIRDRILEQHEELREMLADLETLAKEFQPGGPVAAAPLRERGLALYAKLSDHLDFEDDLLVAALRAVGEGGEERAEDLAAEHREQRELLEFLIDRLTHERRPTVLVARELRGFIECLREDMEDEEATLLVPEVLADVERAEATTPP
jgi:hemerythrin-like domain-containing protein